jgi:nucleoid-associated protein YgaU
MKKKVKVVNKKRFYIAFTILLFILVLILVITVYAFDNVTTSQKVHGEYTVSQGDTLWDISMRYKGDSDIRTYLYKLMKINDLESSDIQIGLKLLLP